MPKWSKIKTKYKMFLYGTYVAARNSSLAVLGHFSKSVVIVLSAICLDFKRDLGNFVGTKSSHIIFLYINIMNNLDAI